MENLFDSMELNETRIIVSLETKALSNKYVQVLFTPEKFKKLSDFLFEMFKSPNRPEGALFDIEDEVIYDLPSEIKTIYRKKDE